MRDIFQTEDKAYKFQYKFLVKISNIKSVRYGTYTASFIGTRIWNVIPEDCQNKDSLKVFKENMKKWIDEKCPCRNVFGFYNIFRLFSIF